MLCSLLQKSFRNQAKSYSTSQVSEVVKGIGQLTDVLLNRHALTGIVVAFGGVVGFMLAMYRGDTEEEQKIKRAKCVAVVGMFCPVLCAVLTS
jgi:hypothetical protein